MLRCIHCQAVYDEDALASCTACRTSGKESALNETLHVERVWPEIDRDIIDGRPAGLLRWRELLPVERLLDVGAGNTPLRPLDRLFPRRQVWAKIEGANPTGSFKDRSMAVAVSKAIELGAQHLACFTSGNIGSAMAAAASAAGLPATVFLLGAAGLSIAVPEPVKLAQIQTYGAEVFLTSGELAALMSRADELTIERGWTFMHDLQAYQPDGDKTAAYEIAKQLDWSAPDFLVVPVGTGLNLFGLWKGFREMRELGWIEGLPRLVAAQSSGANSLVRAVHEKQAVVPLLPQVKPNLAAPLSHRVASQLSLVALRESNGLAFEVADEELRRAMLELARSEAIWAEPASAAAVAVADQLPADASVVCFLTSHGLKASATVAGWFDQPRRLDASE